MLSASPGAEASGSLEQGILTPIVFAHEMISHLGVHIRSAVTDKGFELDIDLTRKQTFVGGVSLVQTRVLFVYFQLG